MKYFVLSIISFLAAQALAQTGTVKGTIVDAQSELEIIGATVQLLSNQSVGAVTDIDGYFKITDAPLGRHDIVVQYLGYETQIVPNVEITAGKDVVLNVSIMESITELQEVVVTGEISKDRAQNEVAVISARQFSLEEVTRYAGGRADVGRLAANFAGVAAPDDSRNDIVIRGNSPTGVLWRLEGMPIPNPNHFSTLGTTGGPVSALNPNILRNSDFLTGAFPSEYGDALAGVFDLGFRKGNKDRMEYTFQAGAFSGLEGMIEGPLGNNGGSFLIGGRYSLIGLIGAGSTAATPNYQDVAINLDLGKTSIGRFTIFGVGARSDIDFLGSEIDENDLFAAEDEDAFPRSQFAVGGIKHNLIVSKNSYVQTILGFSSSGNEFTVDRYFNLGTAEEFSRRIFEADNTNSKNTLSTFFNTKINKKLSGRAGILVERNIIDVFSRDREFTPDLDGDGINDWQDVLSFDGSFTVYQPYVQASYRLSERFVMNGGIHAMHSSLNGQTVFEPRLNGQYALNNKHSLSFGYGLHHQNAPLALLFLRNPENINRADNNGSLEFLRSHHFVLGYDFKPSKNWRTKVEVYRQQLSNIPVDRFESSYASITEGADFGFNNDKYDLVNEGTGYNQGVELTVERFFDGGFHGLFTASLFESKYTGSDGIERNSPFNNEYVMNMLAGKEWALDGNNKKSLIIDGRVSWAGGQYYTPVDLESSKIAGEEILFDNEAFSLKYDDYFRADLRIGMKINGKKRVSHYFYLDVQNVFNNANIFAERYNRLTNEVNRVDQLGLFPDFLYRIQF